MSSERHLREARELLHARPGELGLAIAAALEAAELRGVRAGLAAASKISRHAEAMCTDEQRDVRLAIEQLVTDEIYGIDPASVEVEPQRP